MISRGDEFDLEKDIFSELWAHKDYLINRRPKQGGYIGLYDRDNVESYKVYVDLISKSLLRKIQKEQKSFRALKGAKDHFYYILRMCDRFLYILNAYMIFRNEIKMAYYTLSSVTIFGEKHSGKIHAQIIKILGKSVDFKPLNKRPDIISHIINFCELDSVRFEIMTNGIEFEKLCLDELIRHGYFAECTARTGDFGADVIAEKDGIKYCFQCKNTKSPSGVKAVQEIISGKSFYKCDYAAVVSANGYTDAAIELAARAGVSLLSIDNVSNIDQIAPKISMSPSGRFLNRMNHL